MSVNEWFVWFFRMRPGHHILLGILLMLAGWALLFAMVSGWLETGYGLAAIGFGASLTGVILSLLGLARYFQLPR